MSVYNYKILLSGEATPKIRSGRLWQDNITKNKYFEEMLPTDKPDWLSRYNSVATTPCKTLGELKNSLGRELLKEFKHHWVKTHLPKIISHTLIK